MHPKKISIHDYTYQLPDEYIAGYPLEQRDASRLLVYRDGRLKEDIYRNIASYLPAQSLLVFNNTKVVEARLLFKKPTGASIEIFCLEPHAQYPDITTAMQQRGAVVWMCLVGGASKWKHGQVLEKKIPFNNDQEITLRAAYLGKEKDSVVISLTWTPHALTFAELLHQAGVIPLPPYIKRAAESSDADRYQTIYAEQDGSVAAPTAGLHFTPAIFQALDAKKIRRSFVTLHVGAGTFQPVKSNTLEQHDMHSEFINITYTHIREILDYHNKHITVVGTTSLRTVESLYWLGVKLLLQPAITREELVVHQWDAYELDAEGITVREALEALLNYMRKEELEHLITKTQLLITPGYTIRIPTALVTNFHQPQSTLLLLVAAFIGKDWKNLYQYALDHQFRFLSYGDGCLLFNPALSSKGVQG